MRDFALLFPFESSGWLYISRLVHIAGWLVLLQWPQVAARCWTGQGYLRQLASRSPVPPHTWLPPQLTIPSSFHSSSTFSFVSLNSSRLCFYSQ